MKRILLLITLLSLYIFSFGQDFPAKFIGNWQGDLLWYKKDGKAPQKVKMQLSILPTDTANQYSWQIIYGDKNEDNRPYILKPVDVTKGHWIIDEKNGIVIDQYWLANKLTCAFTVQSSTIINTYYLRKKKLIIEFYNTSSKPINTSGSTTTEMPQVNSYEVKTYQKAILRRKKK
jgi:hypothetical protein